MKAQNKNGFSKNWNFKISSDFKKLVKSQKIDVSQTSKNQNRLGVFLPMSNQKGFIIIPTWNCKN